MNFLKNSLCVDPGYLFLKKAVPLRPILTKCKQVFSVGLQDMGFYNFRLCFNQNYSVA